MDEVRRQLLNRVEQAAKNAGKQQRRASELIAFTSALRVTALAELVRCAWCARVAAGEFWVDPYPLLGSDLCERLRDSASHGICPTCFDRVMADAERERERRRHLEAKP